MYQVEIITWMKQSDSDIIGTIGIDDLLPRPGKLSSSMRRWAERRPPSSRMLASKTLENTYLEVLKTTKNKQRVFSRRRLSIASLPTGCILSTRVFKHTYMYMTIPKCTCTHIGKKYRFEWMCSLYNVYNVLYNVLSYT